MDGNGVRRVAPRLQLGALIWCGEGGPQGPDRKVVKGASCLKVPVFKCWICWVFSARAGGRSLASILVPRRGSCNRRTDPCARAQAAAERSNARTAS